MEEFTFNQSRLAFDDDLISKLLQRDRHKDQFLASLAHELRNPLAPIKHALDSMSLTELTGEVEDLRKMMSCQVDQLVHLVDDLLDLSRVNCGKIVVNKIVIPLKVIIESAVQASSTLIAESGQILTVAALNDDDVVFVDPSRLIQVVTNLLNNSAKFGYSGGHIALSIVKEPGFVSIRIADDGRGIAEDQLERIFSLYAQVENSTGNGAQGLGIGLALAKNLVELHEGTIIAESDGLGTGSRFTVRLPTSNQPASDDSDPIAQNKLDNGPSRSLRVLVVEDLRPLRVMLAGLLEKLGHTVEVAEQGAAALEKLEEFSPDIIFSDISMPGMGGHELAKKLRQRADMKTVVIVAMTGSGTSLDRKQSLESGFDVHLEKPIDIRQLRKVLHPFSSLVL